MPNDCFPGEYWLLNQDEEGNFFDHDENLVSTWMAWTQVLGQAVDDQMCGVQHDMELALATAIASLPLPSEPTETQVIAALGAPAAAITAQSAAAIATVSVLGLTVLAGPTGDVITNLRTRVAELENRLQMLGLLL